jgi:hydroxymethylpyrimidine/phosphomethylpyrimidine kinase
MEAKKILLTIAGFDPTGGAGISRDLMVFNSLGFTGVASITSIVVQDTFDVRAVYPVPLYQFQKQLQTLLSDIKVHGVKIGVIGNSEILSFLSEFFEKNPFPYLVIDPIIKSSRGRVFLKERDVIIMMERLFPFATVVTPNINEASEMTGKKISDVRDMEDSAIEIYKKCKVPVLIKGGHLQGEKVDILYDGKGIFKVRSEEIRKNVHGTGCIFSSAILCYLAKGLSLRESVRKGKEFVTNKIKESFRLGKGQFIAP